MATTYQLYPVDGYSGATCFTEEESALSFIDDTTLQPDMPRLQPNKSTPQESVNLGIAHLRGSGVASIGTSANYSETASTADIKKDDLL